jgi:hypothetical protein
MALADVILAFRLMIDEADESVYTDLLLSDRLDAAVSQNRLAQAIWLEKAARYSRLVDMQEGTSRRSLSQMMDHALLMAKTYGTAADSEDGGSTSGKQTQTRAIERV